MKHQMHGLRKHHLYSIWSSMKGRCSNKNASGYKNYGGRGLEVCEEWQNDFKSFYDFCQSNGWDPNLQIDRIDNDKGYFPDNCRFITSRNNTLNRGLFRTNKSGYTGIFYYDRIMKWTSNIRVKGKRIYLGSHATIKSAVESRNNYIINNELDHEYKIQQIRHDLT